MNTEGRGNAGLMDNEENQKQVSHRCPQPLEIARGAIPTFPPPRLRVEKWKTKNRFPTFPLVALLSQNQIKKGNPAADRFAPAFRLILVLENATYGSVLDRTPYPPPREIATLL